MTETKLEKIDPRFFIVAILAIIISVFTMLYRQSESFLVSTISISDAKLMLDTGTLVIDARSDELFQKGHLPGAISYPLKQLQDNIPIQLEEYKNKSILVYGCSGSCGPHAAYLLLQAGYANVFNIDGGYCAWKNAGYKVIMPTEDKATIKKI